MHESLRDLLFSWRYLSLRLKLLMLWSWNQELWISTSVADSAAVESSGKNNSYLDE